jgi:hypothetical protein
MNNSIPHLVARALRGRRTVTSGLTLINRFHGLTRSQILKEVRKTHLEDPKGFNYGVEYKPSLDRSKLPNPEAYGLEAYAHLPPPEPTPPAIHYSTRIRSLMALRLQNEAALLRSLGNIFDTTQADKLQEVAEFLSRSTEK